MHCRLFNRTLGVRGYGFTFEPQAKELRITSNLALHESALFVIVQNAMLEAENSSEEPEKWMAVL
jgi:hypothetical protein